MKNVHLFFDVYIEDAEPGVYLRGDRVRFNKDKKIREKNTQYRYQTKLNITRYTLYSYSHIDWKSATIRIFCENDEHSWIYDEIKTLFPNAKIERSRSDTSKIFLEALDKLVVPENDWIFFSTNNDHPFIGNPKDFEKIINELNVLEESILADKKLAFVYSHFTESNNIHRISSPLWGYYGGVFPKCIFENKSLRVLKLNRYCLDSILMLKLKDLKEIFKTNTFSGRVIRTEDTSHYLEKTDNFYMVCPKVELCRHYDGITKFLDRVPPLFIPSGFFDNDITIKIDSKRASKNEVLINPNISSYSYQSVDGADLICHPNDIPFFWKNHIKNITTNINLDHINRDLMVYYKLLENPWYKNSKIFNIGISFLRYIKYLLKRFLIRIGIITR